MFGGTLAPSGWIVGPGEGRYQRALLIAPAPQLHHECNTLALTFLPCSSFEINFRRDLEKSSISVPLLQPAGTFGALRGFWGVPRQQEEHVRVFCDAERADGVLGPS